MAKLDTLPDDERRSVNRQLGRFLATPRPLRAAALGDLDEPRLAESLAVCHITAGQVTDPPADVKTLAQPGPLWHHQIRTRGGATHTARSTEQALARVGGLEVEQMFASPIAGKIDAAMAWVDRKRPDDNAVVRLMDIPAYYVHALAIVDGDAVTAVLADQPGNFTKLEYETEYPLAEFLTLLAQERPAGSLRE